MSLAGEYADGWSHIRDHSRPVTLYDRDRLEDARTFTPPSKAHKKRLTKRRADVVDAKPEVSTRASNSRVNEMIRLRNQSRAELFKAALVKG